MKQSRAAVREKKAILRWPGAGDEPCAIENSRTHVLHDERRKMLKCIARQQPASQTMTNPTLNLLSLADTTAAAAPALAQHCSGGDCAEATTLVGEPLSCHLAVLAVDGHGHAAGADEHASATPELDSAEVVLELRDQVASNHWAREGKDCCARVHHARPLAEFGLRSRVGSQDVRDRGGRKADNCTGEDAEDDDESDGRPDSVGERPEDEYEERCDRRDEAVDVHSAKVVAQVC